MRLLLTTDAVGGVWQYSIELARALSGSGIETVLAVLGPSPTIAQRTEALAVPRLSLVDTQLPLDWLCDNAAPVVKAGAAIAQLALSERVDLVQLNMPTLAAGGDFAVPVVSVTHGCVGTWWAASRATPLAPEYRWHRRAMAAGLAASDRVVAPSAAYATAVADYYGLAEVPEVVHNGRTAPASVQAAPLHDCVLTVGRLWDKVKNAALLDAVAARLVVPFHAAGAVRGPHGETIALDHLHWLGELSSGDLAAHVAQRPVFVSAATFEPFGLSVLEAAAAGCALVLSDIPTFRELWDGVATFVPPSDATGYVAAIEALIADTATRAAMGEVARDRAQRYTPEQTARAMRQVYARELQSAAAPTSGKKVAA